MRLSFKMGKVKSKEDAELLNKRPRKTAAMHGSPAKEDAELLNKSPSKARLESASKKIGKSTYIHVNVLRNVMEKNEKKMMAMYYDVVRLQDMFISLAALLPKQGVYRKLN